MTTVSNNSLGRCLLNEGQLPDKLGNDVM